MTKARDLANASTALSAVSATELAFVDGVTSAIQTQLDAKVSTATAATTYVANSLADAKGDLLTATADNTPARLAVGSNGETLVADSSTSTGLRYQVPVNANPVLNSAFQIWQRGTSLATGTTGQTYQADRWNGYRAVAGATVSRQVTGDTTNLPFIQYCARVQRDSGNTATNPIILSNNFETINAIPFAGKSVVLSFYARAGANFSSSGSLLPAQLITGTGTDQNWITGYTGQAVPINQNVTLTTTWQRFSVTGTIAATATELAIDFNYSPTGTAGAADYFEVTGVQLEVGSVATPFKTYAGTIQGELAACQRYYFRNTTGQSNGLVGQGIASSTTDAQILVNLPVQMRTTPTSVDYSTLRLTDLIAINSPLTSLTITTSESSPLIGKVVAVISAALTQYRPTYLSAYASAAGYIGFSAEL